MDGFYEVFWPPKGCFGHRLSWLYPNLEVFFLPYVVTLLLFICFLYEFSDYGIISVFALEFPKIYLFWFEVWSLAIMASIRRLWLVCAHGFLYDLLNNLLHIVPACWVNEEKSGHTRHFLLYYSATASDLLASFSWFKKIKAIYRLPHLCFPARYLLVDLSAF